MEDESIKKSMPTLKEGARSPYIGGATALDRKTSFSGDPQWEQRFENLIRLTQRTELIIRLTGTDLNQQKLKEITTARLLEMGQEVARPRGVGQSFTSVGFLKKMAEKYDAAYLLALHFGANGPGEMAQIELNLGLALDRRLEVYTRYCTDIYGRTEDAQISFETYIVLLDAIKEHAVKIHDCKDCGSRYPWLSESLGKPYCPICTTHHHDVEGARQKLSSLLKEKRESHKISQFAAE